MLGSACIRTDPGVVDRASPAVAASPRACTRHRVAGVGEHVGEALAPSVEGRQRMVVVARRRARPSAGRTASVVRSGRRTPTSVGRHHRAEHLHADPVPRAAAQRARAGPATTARPMVADAPLSGATVGVRLRGRGRAGGRAASAGWLELGPPPHLGVVVEVARRPDRARCRCPAGRRRGRATAAAASSRSCRRRRRPPAPRIVGAAVRRRRRTRRRRRAAVAGRAQRVANGAEPELERGAPTPAARRSTW